MPLTFVNINGEQVNTTPVKKSRKKNLIAESYHKGFKVVGIPPGEYERAQEANKAAQIVDRNIGSEVRPDLPHYEQWANQFRSKPVRAKPYQLQQAAAECARLAVKAGWDRVAIMEMKLDLNA